MNWLWGENKEKEVIWKEMDACHDMYVTVYDSSNSLKSDAGMRPVSVSCERQSWKIIIRTVTVQAGEQGDAVERLQGCTVGAKTAVCRTVMWGNKSEIEKEGGGDSEGQSHIKHNRVLVVLANIALGSGQCRNGWGRQGSTCIATLDKCSTRSLHLHLDSGKE